ncbi:MAG: hypothetical protein IJF49_01110 [Clostridia bacterium]|nr:hypothetical protein [Clostridia bacterium]
MKRYLLCILIYCCILFFPACGDTADVQPPAPMQTEETTDTANENTIPEGRTYVYEGEGCGGAFNITLFENGSFSYYEGMFSSHIGFGTWSIDSDILTLSEDEGTGHGGDFRFLLQEDELHYLAEGSQNFLYVRLENGAVFRHLDPTQAEEGDIGLIMYVSP